LAVRPMGLAVAMFFWTLVAILAGIPATICGAFRARGQYRWFASVGILVNLAPLPLSMCLFHWIVTIKGLIVEP
jgi:hypothetical protein